ncbi:MAG: hypothetical protein A2Y48_04665 [Nitrospirae bacterium RIFCSPLOW2_12_42_9]|nr:MAG: hypothetical protein A2Y48_04665 [Nitrospirae bacterium RIFCSPLOW2_12_42_9]
MLLSIMDQCLQIKNRLIEDGVYIHWRISPEPFRINERELTFIESLGAYLHKFYKASNKLYYESVHGRQPSWVSEYLDQGKPQALIEYSRMNRMKGLLPAVIRPDIILTEDGMVATELDSVPGGIGITGSLARAYSFTSKSDIAGGRDGMTEGFLNMLKSAAHNSDPVIAIVVSQESKDYKPEMEWMAKVIRDAGFRAWCIRPEDVIFTEGGLFLNDGEDRQRIDILYRFFELFDLKNVSKVELIMYSAKKREVAVTPPFKPFLEEKLLYALFHHPGLKKYWLNELGEETFTLLANLFPATWILDPGEMPPYGVIPGLEVGGMPVTKWSDLKDTTQAEREFVIKPSGFSELAWGSRGVVAGHDISQKVWGDTIEKALMDFNKNPRILQEYHRGRHVEVSYMDESSHEMNKMPGRVRLCPYYFVEGPLDKEDVRLRGIMATICPLDKKLIHGMEDAVITVAGA